MVNLKILIVSRATKWLIFQNSVTIKLHDVGTLFLQGLCITAVTLSCIVWCLSHTDNYVCTDFLLSLHTPVAIPPVIPPAFPPPILPTMQPAVQLPVQPAMQQAIQPISCKKPSDSPPTSNMGVVSHQNDDNIHEIEPRRNSKHDQSIGMLTCVGTAYNYLLKVSISCGN